MCTKPITPPPATLEAKFTENPSCSENITFGTESLVLLPPVVKVNVTDGTIFADTLVFIDSSIKKPNFSVYYEFTTCTSGVPQISVFVCFCKKIIKPYKQYTVHSLTIDLPLLNEQKQVIQNIKTFLWDEDPETSRGTVTTVQTS